MLKATKVSTSSRLQDGPVFHTYKPNNKKARSIGFSEVQLNGIGLLQRLEILLLKILKCTREKMSCCLFEGIMVSYRHSSLNPDLSSMSVKFQWLKQIIK